MSRDKSGDELQNIDLSPKNGRVQRAEAAEGSTGTRVAYVDEAGTAHEVEEGVAPVGQGFTVNLQGVSVQAAADALFGKVLGLPYQIDPDVSATVTLATGGPIERDRLIGLFEAALEADGLALLQTANGYRISQGGDAPTARLAAGGYGLTAVQLHRVAADRMLSLLDGFAAPEGALRAAADGEIILIRGGSTERADLAALISSLDMPVMADPSSGIAFLQAAPAASVATELQSVEDGAVGRSDIRVLVLDRSNALIVRAPNRSTLNWAMGWIRRLDQSGGSAGSDIEVYQVQYARASSLASVLQSTLGEGDAAAADPTAAVVSTELSADVPVAANPDAGMVTALDLGAAQGGAVHFTPNDADNTIIIRAPVPVRREALSLLAAIDRPPVQVLIDVMLVEVTLNDATRLGVQAYLRDSRASLIAATDSTAALTPNLPGANLVLGRSADPRLIIDTLSQVTDVKVVSAPSVAAFENEQAEIKVVEQVPIVTQQVQATTDPNAPTVNSVEYRDAGVIMRVTPQVSETNLVNLQVKQELSAVVGQTDGQSTLTPTLRQRSISTRVAVYDGQTVVLGGLMSTQSTRSKGGDMVTRLLGGHRTVDAARTELVVFITPHVMRNQQDVAAAAQEIRRKMTMMGGQ